MAKRRNSSDLPDQVVMTKLKLNPAEWSIEYHIGKPALPNPGNRRSWVECTVTYLPTKREVSLGQRGKFTRNEARAAVANLIEQAVGQLAAQQRRTR